MRKCPLSCFGAQYPPRAWRACLTGADARVGETHEKDSKVASRRPLHLVFPERRNGVGRVGAERKGKRLPCDASAGRSHMSLDPPIVIGNRERLPQKFATNP